MKRIEIKNPSELSSAWMMLVTAEPEEAAIKRYEKKHGIEPKIMIVLPQPETGGTLLYFNYPNM